MDRFIATWTPRVLSALRVIASRFGRKSTKRAISVTTGTYVEVIESVKRDALDSMGTLLPAIEAGTDETG